MSSKVSVYVVYDSSVKSVSLQDVLKIIESKQPPFFIEKFSDKGEISFFAVGLYDWAPVRIYSNTDRYVREEAGEMADECLKTGKISASDILKIRQTDARFEIIWDITDDPDPVPETTEVVSDIAEIIVGLTGGLPLIDGNRLLSFNEEPWEQLMP